nr:RNA-directed DNA polymerase, eukaryota [Tanacetum cinerariifolium]
MTVAKSLHLKNVHHVDVGKSSQQESRFRNTKIMDGMNQTFTTSDSCLRLSYPRLFALENNKVCTVAAKMSAPFVLSLRRYVRAGEESAQLSRIFDLLEIVIPIKVNVLAWKISMDRLPTWVNLHRHGVQVSPISCPICCEALENLDHLLFCCDLAKDIARFNQVRNKCWKECFTLPGGVSGHIETISSSLIQILEKMREEKIWRGNNYRRHNEEDPSNRMQQYQKQHVATLEVKAFASLSCSGGATHFGFKQRIRLLRRLVSGNSASARPTWKVTWSAGFIQLEAKKVAKLKKGPVGAVSVQDDKVIARDYNLFYSVITIWIIRKKVEGSRGHSSTDRNLRRGSRNTHQDDQEEVQKGHQA